MIKHKPTSRPKPPPPGVEEAGETVNLGEFEGVETLSLSEASLVINALMAKRRNERRNVNETEVLHKTIDYLDAFARIKKKENVEAVERLLSARPEFSKFERAAVASLCPDSAEEAKKLIPSLKDKFDDHDLDDLLKEMVKFIG